MSLFGNILGIAAPVVGGIFGGPAGALVGASIGGRLGGGNKGGSNGQASPQGVGGSSSTSGFGALPPEVQQAFLQQYLPQLQAQTQGKYQGTPMGQAETGPFASQGLQQLQQYSNHNGGIFGNGTGVNPIGTVEPFNQYQQNALTQAGGGIQGLKEQLPGYQDLWNENVLNPQLQEMDYQNALKQHQLLSSKAGNGNLGAFSSSALGTQLAQQQQDANRLKLNARAEGFQGAQQLRNQTLQEMLGAGNMIQGQNQQSLNALQPQLQQATPGAQLSRFQQGLNAFPNSSTSMGYGAANPGTPNLASQIGNIGTALYGAGQQLGLQGFGNNGGQSSWGGLLGGNQQQQPQQTQGNVGTYRGNYSF